MLLSKNTRCTQHADANEAKLYPIYSTSKLHVTKIKTPDLKMSLGWNRIFKVTIFLSFEVPNNRLKLFLQTQCG